MEERKTSSLPDSPVNPKHPEESLEPKKVDAVDPEAKGTDSSSQDVSRENGTPDKEKQENTRSKLALLFVLGFFAILFLCFIYAFFVEASINDLKDTLIGVIGALAGILGFIVGYYYKTTKEK